MLLHFHMADLSAARRLVLKLGNPGLGYWVDATLRWLLCLMMGKWHQIRWRCHEHFDRASSCRPLQAAKPVIKATALKYVLYLGKIIMQILTPSLDAILNMLRFSTATTVLLLLLLLSLLVFYYSAVVSTLEWKFWLQISTWGASPFAWKRKKKTFMHPIHSFSPPLSLVFQSSPSFFLPPSSTTGWHRLIGDDTETCHVLLCSLLCIIKTRATLHLHCSGRQMRARARHTGGEIRERKRERERERGERVFCYFSS